MKKTKKTKRTISKAAAWDWFSLALKLKYANKDGMVKCYTCGVVKPIKEMQAGHALTGRKNSILFDEEIVKPQCERCNIWLYGNLSVFSSKLIAEHGMDWWQKKLEQHALVVKLTDEDLKKIYDESKAVCDELLPQIKVPDNLPIRWKQYRERLLQRVAVEKNKKGEAR